MTIGPDPITSTVWMSSCATSLCSLYAVGSLNQHPSFVPAAHKVMQMRLAAIREASALVIRPQLRIIRAAVEPQIGLSHLRRHATGPVQQGHADAQSGMLAADHQTMHVERVARIQRAPGR